MKLMLGGLTALLLCSCSTTSGVMDAMLPDRYGLGSSFTTGGYSGRQVGQTGADTIRETGSYELDSIVTWLEWDIPSMSDKKVSVADMRRRVASDYNGDEAGDSLLSLTRRTSVDEATGAVSESWSFGAAEALSSAIVGLLSFMGYRLARAKFSSGGGEDCDEGDGA